MPLCTSRAALRALQVTLRLAELLTKPAPAWHELMYGQLHVQLGWTDLAATGAGCGIVRHILRLERSDPDPPARCDPA